MKIDKECKLVMSTDIFSMPTWDLERGGYQHWIGTEGR